MHIVKVILKYEFGRGVLFDTRHHRFVRILGSWLNIIVIVMGFTLGVIGLPLLNQPSQIG
jgi:hypothetical protein